MGSFKGEIDVEVGVDMNRYLGFVYNGGFKVSSGTVQWYRSSYCTGCEHSEIASTVAAREASCLVSAFRQKAGRSHQEAWHCNKMHPYPVGPLQRRVDRPVSGPFNRL